MLNTYYHIRPYQSNGLWFFDDPKVGLIKEGLTDGVPEVLVGACLKCGIDPSGFLLRFSPDDLFEFHLKLSGRLRNGHLYLWLEGDINCWFCPALLRYFNSPPENISFNIRLAQPPTQS